MQPEPISYKRHRFPPEIIAHAVWLYVRFNLSLREVEDLYIEEVLRLADGNKVQAAKILGIDRKTLYRRAEKSVRRGVRPERSSP